MYSSTLSLTSALVEGMCSTPRPGRFTPGKEEAGRAAGCRRTKKQWLSRHLLDLTAVGKRGVRGSRLHLDTLRTGDADLRLYITTVQDG